MHLSLKRPIRRRADEAVPNRIVPDVKPFLLIGRCRSYPCIPMIRLPTPVRIPNRFRELGLPILHPAVKRNVPARPAGKEMDMIRHDDIAANSPRVRLLPDASRGVMNSRLGQPAGTAFRANRSEDDGWLAVNVENAVDRMTTVLEVGGSAGASPSRADVGNRAKRHRIVPCKNRRLGRSLALPDVETISPFRGPP